jgi:hypothetical protein
MTADFSPNARVPDPAVEVLHDSFLPLRLFSATVERLATGMRWAEGPGGSATGATCWCRTSRTTASCAGTKPRAP